MENRITQKECDFNNDYMRLCPIFIFEINIYKRFTKRKHRNTFKFIEFQGVAEVASDVDNPVRLCTVYPLLL